MRRASFVVVFAIGANRAWAQPTTEAPPSEGAPAEPTAEEAKPAEPTPEAKVEPKAEPEAKPDPQVIAPGQPAPPTGDETPMTISESHPGFRFGSYGRVLAGSDLRGGKPEKVAIVAHAPRIVEPSYLELDLSYGFRTKYATEVRPVVTVAFDGTLFHDTGEFDAQPALRNVYLDAGITQQLTAWVGSRMYRGDDIHLFDYWPLDDQNTVGGGLSYRQSPTFEKSSLEVAAHVGFNRLNHPFQFQEITVPNPAQGATTVVQLNRQRAVASATIAYLAHSVADRLHAKVKVHGEVHMLDAGARERMDGTLEQLPSDRGMLIGAQLGAFGSDEIDARHRRHLNLFVRYANGLAAFDELAPPTTFGNDLTTERANELTLGLSGNYDHALGNVLVAALSRRFIDADDASTDPDDGWEYAIDVRPLVNLMGGFFAGADVSYQARFPKGLNPITLRAEDPAVFQIAPMLAFSPMGPSAYDRPQLRLVYRAAHLNSAARNLYVPADPRRDREWVHFVGVAAEWWFNSSTYR